MFLELNDGRTINLTHIGIIEVEGTDVVYKPAKGSLDGIREHFETEEDAIISLLNFYNSNKNIPKETAYRYILDERREKDFEMIF